MFGNSFIFVLLCMASVRGMSVPTPLTEVWEEDSDYSEDLQQRQQQQQPNPNLSTSLATIASLIDANQDLNFDLYPTLHSAIMGPFGVISRSLTDLLKLYDQRSVFDIFSLSSLKSAVVFIPHRVVEYWTRLLEMEVECMYRTICDLSAYISPRIPHWMNQMMGIYFTTQSHNNMYYRAVANGMINHNCINYYPKCSPKLFFTRLASNMSEIITTTMSPLKLKVINAINNSGVV